MHFDSILGKQFLYHLRPLNEARTAAVEVLLAADVVCLAQVLDAIEVEVKDRPNPL